MHTKKSIEDMFLAANHCGLEVQLKKYTIAELRKIKQEVCDKKLKDVPPKKIRKKNTTLKETNHSKEDDGISENDTIIIIDDEVDGDVSASKDVSDYLKKETEKFKSQLLFYNKLNTKNKPDNSKNSSNLKPSTSKCNENTDTLSEKPANPSSSLVNKVRICDIRKLIDVSKYKDYDEIWLGENRITNETKKTGSPNNKPASLPVIGHLSLVKIENLYEKYFSRTVHDTIVIIANILNLIKISNKHHKTRMDESLKKITEAEKLKERCDANRQHTRHNNFLEHTLKMNFTRVLNSFEESDFETIFKMFFLAILHVLDQLNFTKSYFFKSSILLLLNSLKNSDFEHPKVFKMLKSKSFLSNCKDLNKLIKASDNGTGRLALFFMSNVKSFKYFEAIVDTITCKNNNRLDILIDKALFVCRQNSTYVTSIITTVTSTATTVPSIITSVTSTMTNVTSTISTDPSINTSVPSFNAPVSSSVIDTVLSNSSSADKTAQLWLMSKAPTTSSFQVPKTNSISMKKTSQSVPSDLSNNKTITPKPKLNVIDTPNVVLTQDHGQATQFVVIKPDNNGHFPSVGRLAGQRVTIPQNVNTMRTPPPIALSLIRSDWHGNHMNACEQLMQKRKQPNHQ